MNERNWGIDLLRIVSMFGIVLLHIISIGGVLQNIDFLSTKYNFVYCLYVAAMCAANCYALISGYVGYDKKFKIKNILRLWIQVAFYSILLTIIIYFVKPGSVSIKDILMSFLPITNNSYWYFTEYFILFFFMPILNIGIQKMENQELKRILIILIAAITISNIIGNSKDIFKLDQGYSALWLIILYVLGAYLNKAKCFEKSSKRSLLLWYVLSVFITFILGIAAGVFSNKFLGRTVGFNIFNIYTSPTIVMESVFLVLLFSKINITSENSKNIIKKLAASSFSVFLIHVHPFIKLYFFKGQFAWISEKSIVVNMLLIVCFSFIIWGGCSVVDFFRQYLFKLVYKMIGKHN